MSGANDSRSSGQTPWTKQREGYTVAAVTDERSFAALRGEWDDLLERSSENRPFSTWTWVTCWWEHHRRGKRLFILTIRDGKGRLAGLVRNVCNNDPKVDH